MAHVPSHHDHQVGEWIGIRAEVDHVVTFAREPLRLRPLPAACAKAPHAACNFPGAAQLEAEPGPILDRLHGVQCMPRKASPTWVPN